LGRSAQFQNWEQVGQVVTQYVTGHRNGVFATAHALNRVLGCTFRGHNLDFQAIGVVLWQVCFDLFNNLGIVSALGVQPENGRSLRCPGTGNGQFDPVANRNILGLGGAPDITGFHLVAHQHVASLINDVDGAVFIDDERLIVRPVFFGLLGHQTNVWYGSHGGRVIGTVCAAVLDHGLENTGIRRVRNHGQGVLGFVVLIPHFAAGTNHGRHGSIHDHIRWDVQVGDTTVGVDHGQIWAIFVGVSNFLANTFGDVGIQLIQASFDTGQTVIGRQAGSSQLCTVFFKYPWEVGFDDMTEDDRVGNLRHGGLHMC